MAGKIEFTKFEAKEKENPYVETVQALAEANDPDAAVVITAPVDKAQYERNLFQRAANKINKTARLRFTDESGVSEDKDGEKSGDVKMTFTLSNKHKTRRGGKSE